MAGFQKKVKCPEQYSCNISFNCDLNPSSRGVIVSELIKYCMYEREQIPLPFENLKRDTESDGDVSAKAAIGPQDDHEGNARQRKVLKKVSERKSQNAVSSLEQLFDNLSRLFQRYPEIHQVLFLLGGTVISPKETYLVNLPPNCPDAEPPADRSYVKHLYRQLITQDMLGHVKSIAPTSMTVLVLAPRDCGIEWFLPKPAFKVPQKSKQFEFNISCKQSSSSSHNLTQADEEFNISGIEPLSVVDISASELSGSSVLHIDEGEEEEVVEHASTDSVSTSSCSYFSRHLAGSERHPSTECPQQDRSASNMSNRSAVLLSTDSGFDSVDLDMIWFQSPVVVKGYRNKVNHMD